MAARVVLSGGAMTDEIITSADVSKNRVWGVLGATSVADVLDSCRRRRVTGEISFHTGDDIAVVELRAGSVERVEAQGKTGRAAMAAIEALREGTFEVVQRLPDLGGMLGTAAEFRGEIDQVPLIQVMRHVENHALSVTLTVVHEFDRGVIRYREGEIVEVELNGVRDLDLIGDLLKLPDARYRVMAAPLDLPLPTRPAPRRLPTEPFHVGHVRGLVAEDDDDEPELGDGWSRIAPPPGQLLVDWLGKLAAPRLKGLHQRAQRAVDRLGAVVARFEA
jgi:hypothetical protein